MQKNNQPQPNNTAAINFLKRWSPLGPWVLTAIQTDRKAIATKTFRPKDEDALVAWLSLYNGNRNLYFHVNTTINDLSKKAEREDIKEVPWLHVDIDPRAGENLEDEKTRCYGLLTTKLPEGVPPPSVIIFSGGGYQAFWKLKEPIVINGDITLAEGAKQYNQQLEVLFGADNCHNIDRIMRLPGSVNIPDARKLKKGRTATVAELIEFNDSTYPLTQFSPATTVQIPEEKGFNSGSSTPLVQISGNIERMSDVAELDKWSVPDRVKVIIVQGNHPDEPKTGDNSRSNWLFDALCNLVRCNVPDDVIYSIITDPDFAISESVIDKGVNAEKYAKRQIERAKEEAINPWFRKLNEKHAVVRNIGGKCRIIEEVWDESLSRTRLTRQSFDDFRNFYCNIDIIIGTGVNGQPQTKPLGQFWLKHPQRRQFDTIVFAPGKEVPGAYNLWKGFACQSRPGDCSLFLTHLQKNVCSDNEEHFQYLLNWMARAIQQPATAGETAIVLRGGRGTGKSFFAKHFGHLFGRHFLHISNPSHLVGNFNSHLRDVIVLFADEAFYAGDKKHSSILKTLITEETITIEAKGVDAEAARNYVHLIMASNDSHVIPAGGDERRFFVLDVGERNKQDTKYFAKIENQLKAGGYEALLHLLLSRDISEFQVRTVPTTNALHEQKLLSLSTEEEWWYQRLTEGAQITNGEGWQPMVLKHDVIDDYVEYTKRFNITRRGCATSLGKFLGKLHPSLKSEQRIATWDEYADGGYSVKKTGRRYFWILPSLAQAREEWEKIYGKEDWLEPIVQTSLPFKQEQHF